MTEKTLYIEIFQPFAQYRNPFTFYYAQSYPLPPKSTIVGMLQNAVGDWYGHEYGLEKWWDNLKISVHGGFESFFWNYQQLIKGEITISKAGLLNRHDRNPLGKIWHPLYSPNIKAQRTPVYQQELFNGHLFIFIRGDEELIGEIKESLEKPKKVLSLGRSEDVFFLKTEPKILEDEEIFPKKLDNGKLPEVKKTLWLTYPTYIKLRKLIEKNRDRYEEFSIKNKKFPVYSIPVKILFKNNCYVIRNKAELNKDTKREVEFETVIHTSHDYVIHLKKEVSVEIYKIGDKTFKIPAEYGWL